MNFRLIRALTLELILISLLLALAGCATLASISPWSGSPVPVQGTDSGTHKAAQRRAAGTAFKGGSVTTVPIESAGERSKNSDVEVIWEIPKELVDGFILKYGYDKEKLGTEVKLTLEQTPQIIHPTLGPVYRYVISAVPPDKVLYVTIAAYRGNEISAQSQAYELPIAQKKSS